MGDPYRDLLEILAEAMDFASAAAVLGWDEQTYMPPGGAEVRGHQMATLSKHAHELFVSEKVGRLLEELAGRLDSLDPDSVEACTIRQVKRAYEREVKLPTRLVGELAQATSAGFHAWVKAKQESSFEQFRPHLERIVELTREKAERLGYEENPYDALLDGYEPGMKTAEVNRLFDQLKARLVPLVRAISERLEAADASVLTRGFDPDRQWAFSLELLKAMGYDFNRGRQDRSEHPFTTAFSPGDVRVTTRMQAEDIGGLFSTIHEGGHALYEQGIPMEFTRHPLGAPSSLGIHESQSRLWENVVGRSRPFWGHFLPILKGYFPGKLEDVDLETWYRAINRVEPSEIRTEADEVTYNLHIFLRFELEQQLLTGRLQVKDLPEAWNAKMREYLGITPRNDARGVLQDVHWSNGMIGYFPTYTLGNILSVQFYNLAVAQRPEIPAEIEKGNLIPLKEWLNQNIHVHADKYRPGELVRKVTGGPIQTGPYLDYIEAKYRAIYGL